MGRHSGYDQVCDAVKSIRLSHEYTDVLRRPAGKNTKIINIILRNLFISLGLSPFYQFNSAIAETQALARCARSRHDLIHVLYAEIDLCMLPLLRRRFGYRVVGTAHQPDIWWHVIRRTPKSITALDSLIVVSSKQADFFEQYLPGRVHFIPHGIDTSFFRPPDDAGSGQDKAGSIRCVYSGKWLRDIQTLVRVIDRVIAVKPDIGFDMIVPMDNRDDPGFRRLASYKQVFWHAHLSDEQLLRVYQNAGMLLLPVIDSTANNALLEAMACGLPIVSNKVGGLLDYTRESFADLLPPGDAEGMANAVLRLADHPEEREKRGAAARLHAEENLTWEEIARRTLDVYERTLQQK